MTFRRLLHDNGGASAVQFAFVGPILILLTLGIIDMGRFGFAATAMRNGAIEAARFASLRGAAGPAPATASAIAAVAKVLTDEEKKQRRDLALIATMGTGIVLTNGLYWGAGMGVIVSALIAITVGAVVGGITFKVKSR